MPEAGRIAGLPSDDSVPPQAIPRRALIAGLGLGIPAAALSWEIERRHPGLPLLESGRVGDTSAWITAGTVPAVPELGNSTMIRDALAALHSLALGGRVPLAGAAGPWRYVWPRDSAFVASALARTGHPSDAIAIISFLQRVQAVDGTFQARYRRDTGRPPDDRGVQLDGTGWALWSVLQIARTLPEPDRAQLLSDHDQLISRSERLLLRLAGRRQFPISPDYWEVPASRPTLATVALIAAGLDAAAELEISRSTPRAGDLAAAATSMRQRIKDRFGRDGYPRELGGRASSIDLGVAFLLPPFAPTAEPSAVRAWADVPERLRRPAGGLAPGGSWRRDGISWTNSTAIAALVDAALGDRAGAVGWLRWMDAHRTARGAIPEKVLRDGRPVSVAPLAWSAAAAVIAADLLR